MRIEEIRKLGVNAFMYCDDCETYYDVWKDKSLVLDHATHKWRFIEQDEFEECLRDCKEWCKGDLK